MSVYFSNKMRDVFLTQYKDDVNYEEISLLFANEKIIKKRHLNKYPILRTIINDHLKKKKNLNDSEYQVLLENMYSKNNSQKFEYSQKDFAKRINALRTYNIYYLNRIKIYESKIQITTNDNDTIQCISKIYELNDKIELNKIEMYKLKKDNFKRTHKTLDIINEEKQNIDIIYKQDGIFRNDCDCILINSDILNNINID